MLLLEDLSCTQGNGRGLKNSETFKERICFSKINELCLDTGTVFNDQMSG